jgi:transglutaminase-like putative cysteine protease
MVLLFLFFPRLAPLWGTPSDAFSGRSGLSARMAVGQIARLALDDSVALRVRFEGAPPAQSALYFRGPVLSTFDGREWLPLHSQFAPAQRVHAQLQVQGKALAYELTLEPHARPWLLTLDATAEPPQLPAGWSARMGEDLQWQASAPIVERLRYRALAYVQFRHGPHRAVAGLHDYLALPSGLNPRTLQWAQQLRRTHAAQPQAIVQAALQQLRSGGYVYTLEPGEYGEHSADEFWFDRKAGFCEHMASAFAVLMRAAGIPARVVTGYQGGERNTLDDYWIVRQSDAHAWTEVWLPQQGWVRVDPTAAVAPARTGSLQRLQAPRGVLAEAVGTVVGPNLAATLRAAWDALNHAWNQRVLNYTQGRQFELLRALGFEAPGWEDLAVVLGAAMALAALVALWGTLWQRRRRDPWQLLLQQARQRLHQLGGAPAGAAVTPRELAARLAQLRDPQDNRVQAIQAWLQRLEQARYARRTRAQAAAELQALRRDFQRLSWPP